MTKRTTVTSGLLLALTLWMAAVACAPLRPSADSTPKKMPAMAGPAARLNSCVAREFSVDYLDALDSIPDGLFGEQEEQLRDWIWRLAS